MAHASSRAEFIVLLSLSNYFTAWSFILLVYLESFNIEKFEMISATEEFYSIFVAAVVESEEMDTSLEQSIILMGVYWFSKVKEGYLFLRLPFSLF